MTPTKPEDALVASLRGWQGDMPDKLKDDLRQAADAIATLLERERRRVVAAYEEGWNAGFSTGEAGGRMSSKADDWELSQARAALTGMDK